MKQVTLLEGQAISMGRNLSFHPIIDLLKNWAGIREDDGEAESFAKLEKAMRAVHPAEADEIIPFVATLMGMKLSGKYAERVKGIEGEALEKLIFKNIRELLIKGSELQSHDHPHRGPALGGHLFHRTAECALPSCAKSPHPLPELLPARTTRRPATGS